MLSANVSLNARTSKDAAWLLEQRSVTLKGSPCSNDRQEKLRAWMARNILESAAFGALNDQRVTQAEILSLLAGHYEA